MQDAPKAGQSITVLGLDLKVMWARMKREPLIATFMVVGVINSFLFSLAILYITFFVWW